MITVNDNLLVRKATPADVPGMKACVDAAYGHYIARIGRPPAPMLDDYAAVVRQHAAFVAEVEGRVVAILVLIQKPDGLLLNNIAVLPEFQGKRLGRRLMEVAESEALRQGFKHIELYTNEFMTENLEIYKHVGYVEIARREEQGYRRVYMRKRFSLFAG